VTPGFSKHLDAPKLIIIGNYPSNSVGVACCSNFLDNFAISDSGISYPLQEYSFLITNFGRTDMTFK
jgi:hypothetical protein